MKDRIHILAAALLLGVPLAAQEDKMPPKESHEGHAHTYPGFMVHRLTQLDKCNVTNPAGEKLGGWHEVLIDPASGEIEYLIISRGGILGIGDDLFAVPFESVKTRVDEEGDPYVVLDTNVEKLKSAPGFPKDTWPQIDEAWERSVYAHFGETAPKTDGMRKLVRCAELEGTNVQGRDEKKLGEVEQIILDPNGNRIAYFVLGTGGVLGLGEKEFALPWEPVKIMFDEEDDIEISFPASEESLKTAPEYVDKDWKRMSDPVWIRQVYVFHSAKPYWSEADEAVEAGAKKPVDKPKIAGQD